MSALWEHRLPVLLAFALALSVMYALYGLPAAFGAGVACLLGYSYGLYESEQHRH